MSGIVIRVVTIIVDFDTFMVGCAIKKGGAIMW